MKGTLILSQIYGIITQEVNDMAKSKKLLVKSFHGDYTPAGSATEAVVDSWAPTRDIKIIGIACSLDMPVTSPGTAWFSASIGSLAFGDVTAGIYTEEQVIYMVHLRAETAGLIAACMQETVMFPEGHYIEVEEGEKINLNHRGSHATNPIGIVFTIYYV